MKGETSSPLRKSCVASSWCEHRHSSTPHAWQVAALRYTVAPFFTHRSDRASLSTLAAALDPKTEGGWYYGPKGFNELRGDPGHAMVHRSARHEVYQERLWDLSCELTGADWPF